MGTVQNQTEIFRQIGHLQGTVSATRNEMISRDVMMRAEYMGHIMLLNRKIKNGNGHAGKSRQWASLAVIAAASLLATWKPELAVVLIKAVLH